VKITNETLPTDLLDFVQLCWNGFIFCVPTKSDMIKFTEILSVVNYSV
jgi:hypothetical protein